MVEVLCSFPLEIHFLFTSKPCAPGTKASSAGSPSCVNCTAGFFSGPGATECIGCEVGYYSGPGAPACSPCPKGTYSVTPKANSSAFCQSCPAGTYGPQVGMSGGCFPCPSGTFSNRTNLIDVLNCTNASPGWFVTTPGQTLELQCPAGTISGAKASFCSFCRTGQVPNSVGTSCNNCSAGTFAPFGASQCFPCDPGTWSGLTSSSCTPCPIGTASSRANASNCDPCPAGFFSAQVGMTSCTPCPSGSYSNRTNLTNVLNCTNASPGYFVTTPGSTSQVQCPAGTFSQGNASFCSFCEGGQIPNPFRTGCSNCSAGTFAPFGASQCFDCDPGTWSGEKSSGCTPCSAGTASSKLAAPSIRDCLGCPAGYYAQQGSSSCTPCPAGTSSAIANATNNTCLPCGSGYYSPPGSANCTKCTSGTFTLTNQSAFCEPCPAGSVPDVGGCQNCSSGTYAPFGASQCFDCPAGSWSGDNAQRCVLCESGTFSSSPRATSNNTCQPCPRGSYSLTAGSTSCSLCEPGTASNVTGASVYSCQPCLRGTFSAVAGSYQCEDCAAGFFSTENRSLACIPCSPGEMQPNRGQTSCLPCEIGRTNKYSGQTSCLPCPAGSAPLTASSGCIECPRGFASSDGRNCSECSGQYYASRSGLATCERCPIGQAAQSSWGPCVPCIQVGYYVDSGLGCVPCPNGTFLNTDTGTCSPCAAGFWSGEAALKCYACPKGSERPASAVGCRSCASGFVAPLEGTVTCSRCGRGQFLVNSSSPCQPCPRNTFSSSDFGASSCVGCSAGFMCPLATAVPVDTRQIPFFAGLVFPRYGISSGLTAPSFNANSLIPQNYWTTANGIAAIVVLACVVIAVPAALALIYFSCRVCQGKAKFESWKEAASKMDWLFAVHHKNGSLPRAVIERKTVFGSVMTISVIVLCMCLCSFLVLNWYYSPVLSSSLVPFGYVGEPDPVASLRFELDLWGWSGPCTLPLGSGCALSFTVDGLSQTNGSQLLVACSNRTYSCFIDISASAAVVSSFGSIRITSPQGGNAMGVTYRATILPSLNDSGITPIISETIFAGASEVFGGTDPVVVSLSTKWSKLRDETKSLSRDGWVVGSAGVVPGSTLNNVTFLEPLRDKQFRLSIALARGTEFLVVSVNYSSSIAILIGSILAYFGTVVAVGRVLMRLIESLDQRRQGEAPRVVTEYLASLAPPTSSSGLANDFPLLEEKSDKFYSNDARLSANASLYDGKDDADAVAMETVPTITRVTASDVRFSTKPRKYESEDD